MAVTRVRDIKGEWKYADVGLLFSSWNPMRWSERMSLTDLAEDVYKSSESNRPINVRFYNDLGTLLLERTFDNDKHARDECNQYIQQGGLEKTTRDAWDPLGLTGPEGRVTNGLKYVPVVGHAVNLTHYAAGKWEVGDEGDVMVSNTTSYVPVLGHAQAVCTGLKNGTVSEPLKWNDLAQKSTTRSTNVAATAGVAYLAAPAAGASTMVYAVQGAVAAGLAGAAGNASQRGLETWLKVDEKNVEKANQTLEEFLSEVKWAMLTGVLCEVGFAGFNSAKTSVTQAFTRQAVEEAGEQSIRIAFREGSMEIIGQAMQQATVEGASESALRSMIDNSFFKSGCAAGFLDTDEYRLLKDTAVKSYLSS